MMLLHRLLRRLDADLRTSGARQSAERVGARAGRRLGEVVTVGGAERGAGDAGRKAELVRSRKGLKHCSQAESKGFELSGSFG